MTHNERVQAAIRRTQLDLTDYWMQTLESRCANYGSGSRFLSNSIIDIEKMLLSADWVPYPEAQHLLLEDCVAYRAEIPGMLGVVKIKSLPESADILLIDRKQTGYLSAEVDSLYAQRLMPVDYTVIILGQEKGEEVVFTVHPGAPIRPSQLRGCLRTVSRDEALDLGLVYAKVV